MSSSLKARSACAILPCVGSCCNSAKSFMSCALIAWYVCTSCSFRSSCRSWFPSLFFTNDHTSQLQVERCTHAKPFLESSSIASIFHQLREIIYVLSFLRSLPDFVYVVHCHVTRRSPHNRNQNIFSNASVGYYNAMYAVYCRGVATFSLPAVHEGVSETAYALWNYTSVRIVSNL